METNEQLESEKQNKKEQVKDVEMSSNAMLKKEERDESQDSDNEDLNGREGNDFRLEDLHKFWDEYVEGCIVDRGRYEDRELLKNQRIWLKQIAEASGSNLKLALTSSAKKSILKSPSNFNMLMDGDVSHFDRSTP